MTGPITVELLTLGHELLDGRRVDTNAAWIGRFLSGLGLQVRFRQTTLDQKEDIVSAFQTAIRRSDLIISTGGLGPTQDDITFESLAEVLGQELHFHPDIEKKIIERYAARNLPYPPSNRRQAMLPKNAIPIPNPLGSAPGCFVELGSKMIFCFPGVPVEMENLFKTFFLETLRSKLSFPEMFQTGYSLSGMGESRVEQTIQEHGLDRVEGADMHLAYTASLSEVEITYSLIPHDPKQKDELMKQTDEKFKSVFGNYLIRWDGKTLEQHIVETFQKNKWKLSLAESMTGGMVTSKLVDVPGCSLMLHEGLVTYSYESKIARLGVKSDTLAKYGAVSVECIREMARGIREKTGSTFSLATSGVAGPDGGSDQKPVGLTYFCWVGPKIEMENGSKGTKKTYVKSTHFDGRASAKKDMNRDLKIVEEKTFETQDGIEKVMACIFAGDRKRNRLLAASRALMGLYAFIQTYENK